MIELINVVRYSLRMLLVVVSLALLTRKHGQHHGLQLKPVAERRLAINEIDKQGAFS